MLALGACVRSLLPLPLPSEVAAKGDRYPVSGTLSFLQRRVNFGPYRLHGRIGMSSTSIDDATRRNSQRETRLTEQKARFTMQGPDGAYAVACLQRSEVLRQHKKGLQAGNGKGLHIADTVVGADRRSVFHCTLAPPSGEAWKLEFDRLGNYGHLTRQDDSFEISPVYPFFGAEPSIVSGIQRGYSFDAGAEALAAVQLETEPATVSLLHEAPPVLAAACGALLLLRTIDP